MRIIFFLILCTQLHARTQSECMEEADRYGNGEGPTYIDKDCLRLARQQARPEQRYSNKDGSLRITAVSNYIVIDKKDKTSVIAGSSTRLHKVRSVKFDEDKKLIEVIDSHTGEDLLFPLSSGNIAPGLKSKDLSTH